MTHEKGQFMAKEHREVFVSPNTASGNHSWEIGNTEYNENI